MMGGIITGMITKELPEGTLTYRCGNCSSTNIVKNGHNRLGQQQYWCKACDARRVLEPRRTPKEENPDKPKALKACLERCSLRGVARIFEISRNTLRDWIREHLKTLPALGDTLLPAQPDDLLEWDEVWSFVGCKADQEWLWTVLCRRTRQIVAYALGDHSAATCQGLWEQLPPDYRACYSYSDFWRAYQAVLPSDQNQAVGKETGETAHQERWGNTLRQWLDRYTRKTLSFSKSRSWHKHFTHWFIIEHNLPWAERLSLT